MGSLSPLPVLSETSVWRWTLTFLATIGFHCSKNRSALVDFDWSCDCWVTPDWMPCNGTQFWASRNNTLNFDWILEPTLGPTLVSWVRSSKDDWSRIMTGAVSRFSFPEFQRSYFEFEVPGVALMVGVSEWPILYYYGSIIMARGSLSTDCLLTCLVILNSPQR